MFQIALLFCDQTNCVLDAETRARRDAGQPGGDKARYCKSRPQLQPCSGNFTFFISNWENQSCLIYYFAITNVNFQKAVRKATSNDPWGPSSTLMAEIADLTYNVVAFTEIMQMLWKRLNDHGKNWRHVYKALMLLEYLIKTGTEKVAQQCKENIFAIQTLKGDITNEACKLWNPRKNKPQDIFLFQQISSTWMVTRIKESTCENARNL